MEKTVARHFEWLQNFRENVEEDYVLTPRDATTNSSRESETAAPKGKTKHWCSRHEGPTFRDVRANQATQRTGKAIPCAEFFGDLITANHNVLSEGFESHHSHLHAFVVLDLASRWVGWSISVQNEKFNWNENEFNEIPEPIGKAWSHFYWGLSWKHHTSTPHRTETKGIIGRAVRIIKEGTSAVLLQSGLDEKLWADSMDCWCYLRNMADRFVRREHNLWSAIFVNLSKERYFL